jgi:putative N-acetyltransferase (TIGR04045 family)
MIGMSRAAVISPFSTPAEADSVAEGLEASCLVAATEEERSIHHAIRRAVFVEEQAFFSESDRDDRDDDPATVKVLALYGQIAGGAVRLYPLDEDGLWKGDRLAVLAAFRPRGLGTALVRFAVRTAGERGGRLMIAHIQPQNVGFFRRLGWRTEGGPEDFVGRTHQKMAIRLGPGA